MNAERNQSAWRNSEPERTRKADLNDFLTTNAFIPPSGVAPVQYGFYSNACMTKLLHFRDSGCKI
jgi:hypothetical protein